MHWLEGCFHPTLNKYQRDHPQCILFVSPGVHGASQYKYLRYNKWMTDRHPRHPQHHQRKNPSMRQLTLFIYPQMTDDDGSLPYAYGLYYRYTVYIIL